MAAEGKSRWQSAPSAPRDDRWEGELTVSRGRPARGRDRGVAGPLRHLAPRHGDQGGGGRRRGAGARGGRPHPGVAGARACRPATASGCSTPWPGCGGPRQPAGATQRRARRPGGGAGGRGARRRPHGHAASAAVGRPAAGCLRRLVRAVPPQRGRVRRRGEAAGGHRRHGLRRGVPAAHPSHRHHRPQGAEQHAEPRPRRSRQPVGHRLGRGRPHRHRRPSWARSTTSSGSARRPRPGPGGGARLRPAVLARPSLGAPAPGVVLAPARRHHPLRREPAQEVPGHLPHQLLARPDADRQALWKACRDVLRYWIDQGIRIFRVDNPHTKPVAFWAWLIERIRRDHPDVVFLSEAFTRPKVMAKLAEVGFTQSYTYFTWRNEPGSCATTSTSSPTARRPTTCGPTSGPTRPTSCPGPCATAPGRVPHALRPGGPAGAQLRHVQRLRAVRERAGQRRQRGVPALREVRDPPAGLGDGPLHGRRSSPGSTRSGGATRRSGSCATSASTASTTSSSWSGPRAAPTRATRCWWW